MNYNVTKACLCILFLSVLISCSQTGNRYDSLAKSWNEKCPINLVKDELYDTFIQNAKDKFKEKFGRSPKIYDVVIGDGARRLV